jgi:SAM-dependent methyltransferase
MGTRKRFYDKSKKRLVYIGNEATPRMWDERWQLREDNIMDKFNKINRTIVRITKKYLVPHDGIILEGGCGNGNKVFSLMHAGYNVIGIDYAPQTVKMLNKVAPQLDIRLADVRNLPLEDSLIAGYWSLGVIEHFFNGYDDIASEMYRVIKPGGYLFLTHPYMSPLRKIKAFLGLYNMINDNGKPEEFYQFAFSHRNIINKFESIGFKLCSFKWGSGLLGFNEEIPLNLTKALYVYRGNSTIIKGARYLADKCLSCFSAHTCLLVFRSIKKEK